MTVHPLRLIYLEYEHDSPYLIQAGVSVSKRNFKSAVQRNRIKRLMRETYRKNKHLVYDSEDTKKHLFMFIYQGQKELDFDRLESKMRELLSSFGNKRSSSRVMSDSE